MSEHNRKTSGRQLSPDMALLGLLPFIIFVSLFFAIRCASILVALKPNDLPFLFGVLVLSAIGTTLLLLRRLRRGTR